MKEVALYPNSISVPLMTNYGVPHQPKGMLHITLHGISNLKSTDLITKGDPYVVFEVCTSVLPFVFSNFFTLFCILL